MKYFYRFLFVLCVFVGATYAQQLNNIATFNRALLAQDTLMPYYNPGVAGNLGIRTVWVATEDLDKDGKQEVLVTDYQNNGRVHVLEQNGDNLEIVWSSPKEYSHSAGSGSTPRWVRTGDMDGDGKGEIIFPLTRGSGDYLVQVYEYNDADNDYQFAISLEANAFTAQGTGNFRTNRELGTVYDFDNDGADELIMTNRDNNVYILGISGDIPGFGGWQLEGGVPGTVPTFGGASHWHSIPADLNGDGNIEIVNLYWLYLGFYTIVPSGPDTYVYPDTSKDNYYFEFTRKAGSDATAFMGIQAVDVDGDGSDEITGIKYENAVADHDYDPFLIDFNSGDDVQYSWDSTKFAFLGEDLWTITNPPHPSQSFWGIGAADLNNNGRQEILLGGSVYYDVVAIEYKGTGSILDPANYEGTLIYDGKDFNRDFIYTNLDIIDSLGVIDTAFVNFGQSGGTAAPFVSKMFAGCDINGNNKQEVLITYQSVHDSVKRTYKRWDAGSSTFVTDSVVMWWNPDQVTVRMLESTVTGIKEVNLGIITPEHYTLEQNYPNPFNPTTSIKFSLPLQKKISIVVYDILGNEVKTLINNQEFEKGSYEVTWDGTNNFGNAVASGQYIYTMKYGNFSKSLKMTLLK